MSLSAQIQAVLHRRPDEPAIEFNGRWWQWRDVAHIADALQALLAQHGLDGGTRLGLVARNRPAQIAAFAGALANHCCVVMIYSAQSNTAIADDIRRLRLPLVVADRQDWTAATIAAARDVGSLGVSLSQDQGGCIVPVEGLTAIGPEFDRSGKGSVVMELLSSGTTGAPKRVPLPASTFEQAVADSAAVYASGRTDPLTSPHVVFHPLGNVAGVTFLIPFLMQGQSVALLEKFSLSGWLDAVARHRPARTSLPPTALRMILDERVPRQALESLASIGVGAAALDPALQEEFEAAYGIPLLAGYGATEFCGVVANWTLDLHRTHAMAKRGSVGKPRPGVSMRIVDPVAGQELAPGETGVLEARVARIGPDWIRTTDLAAIDADGFVFLRGRADGAINRGGFKILPDEVARQLRRHPAVADAVVIGWPDPRLGEVPIAVVEMREGTVAPDEPALLEFARRELVAYQVPLRILVVDELPRNPSMKVILPAVRALTAALIEGPLP